MPTKQDSYIQAVGRRKTAIARVRISEATKQGITVNDKPASEYFPTDMLRQVAHDALGSIEDMPKFTVSAKITGGGISSQAEALRHGISRALVKFERTYRKPLKTAGYLKRDPREKERRKFGLKKARKSAQWSKR